jgi:hypothetical protein
MLLDMAIGTHIDSLLNIFHSVACPLRKTKNYRMSEMCEGVCNEKQKCILTHTCRNFIEIITIVSDGRVISLSEAIVFRAILLRCHSLLAHSHQCGDEADAKRKTFF